MKNEIEVRSFIGWEYFLKGKSVARQPMRPCRSFVKNFYNLFFAQMAWCNSDTSDDLELYDVTGTQRGNANSIFAPESEDNNVFGIRGGAGEDNQGLIVGTDDTAEDFGMGSPPAAVSYDLGAKISHGNGVGELEYQAMEAPTISISGTPSVYECLWRRYFNNTHGSSNDVGIKEVGIYIYNSIYLQSFLLARDKLVSTVTIADTGQYRLDYKIQVTFPE